MKKSEMTDLEYMLGKMYMDAPYRGVDSFLADAIKWVERNNEYDYETVAILRCALAEFDADPCGHLNNFTHLRDFQTWD
jgi:hypothetical protein